MYEVIDNMELPEIWPILKIGQGFKIPPDGYSKVQRLNRVHSAYCARNQKVSGRHDREGVLHVKRIA